MQERKLELIKYDAESGKVETGNNGEQSFCSLLDNAIKQARKRCTDLSVFLKSLREQDKNLGDFD